MAKVKALTKSSVRMFGATEDDVSDEYAQNPLNYVQISALYLINTGDHLDNYVTSISQRIEPMVGKKFSIPHMASVLERMAEKDLCEGATVQPPEGGRARRYYNITEKGKIALNVSWKVVSRPFALVGDGMVAT